jgi:hypothetical protein
MEPGTLNLALTNSRLLNSHVCTIESLVDIIDLFDFTSSPRENRPKSRQKKIQAMAVTFLTDDLFLALGRDNCFSVYFPNRHEINYEKKKIKYPLRGSSLGYFGKREGGEWSGRGYPSDTCPFRYVFYPQPPEGYLTSALPLVTLLSGTDFMFRFVEGVVGGCR